MALDMRVGSGGDVGAGFFPRAISMAMVICGIVIIIQELRKNSQEPLINVFIIKSLLMGAVTVVYVFLMDSVGFVVLTPIYVILFLYLLQQRSAWKNIAYAIGITASVYIVFRIFFNVRLPLSFLGI